MAKLVMMCGVPGSGKSFFSSRLLKRVHSHIYLVSSDGIRTMVHGNPQNFTSEKLTWELFYGLAKLYSLDKKGIVILDATQLTSRHRTVNTKDLKDLFEKRILLVFELEKELVRKQNRERRWPVPDDVLERLLDEYEPPNEQDKEYFTDIFYVKNHDIDEIIKYIIEK